MSRISRQVMFMEVAGVVAKRSTCFRGNVGAVLVHNNNIVSIGYNGPPSGEEHCRGNKCELKPEGGCARSIHAEENCIKRALNNPAYKAGYGYSHDLYCTHAPCSGCAKLMLTGLPPSIELNSIFFRYDARDKEGLKLLTEVSQVGLYRITPSGCIINYRTNEIC